MQSSFRSTRSGASRKLAPVEPGLPPRPFPEASASAAPRRFVIRGVTDDGRVFRPSDWSERLAGALSAFRPGATGAAGRGAPVGYSPYCVPVVIDGVRCVRVDESLKAVEPRAWEFVMNFARDNSLTVVEPRAAVGPFGRG